MKFKNKLKFTKSPYKNINPRVRKSYYTFSREYPAGNIPLERRIHLKFKSDFTKRTVSVLLVILLLGLSFFLVRLPLDISHKTPPVITPGSITASSQEVSGESLLVTEGFRALYMPYEKLGDTAYIRSLIKKVKRYNCNSVIIDFKTEAGKLCYSSLNDYAISGKCAIFDNNTVRQALSLFKKENITVAARIFCFLDNTVPESSPELAVKYMDTDVNWIDTTAEGDGKTWLNPCSKETLAYLLDIITELQNFNIKGFILEKCHFPDSENTGGASFPGENNYKNKNAVLKHYIKSINDLLPPDGFLIVTQNATDSLNGNKKLYFGSIANAEFDAVASYTDKRPDNVLLDKKTHYADMLSLFSSISQNFADRAFMPIIDISEYSGRYLRTIRKNDYKSYIIFDESGEY